MKTLRLCLALAVTAVASLSVADAKKEIEAAYAKLNATMLKKDLKGIMAFTTKDFVWTSSNGQSLTRGQMEEQLKEQLQMIKKMVKVTVKVDKLTAKGKDYVAKTTGTFEADVALTPDAKKASRLKSVSITEDTWTLVNGKWLIKRVKSNKETTTLDGKPIGGM